MEKLLEKILKEGSFADPFSGKLPDKKLTDLELIRAIRLDIAAEEEAIHLYTAHAEATDNEVAKKVLLSIADEEKVHVGELQRLLTILDSKEEEFLSSGGREVDELIGEEAPKE